MGIELTGAPLQNSETSTSMKRVLRRAADSKDAGYVIATDQVDAIASVDIVTVSSFHSVNRLLKARVRKGLGIEFLVSPARTQSAEGVAKWLADLKAAYRFCKSAGCQFILSSGGEVPTGMVSGRCIDELLGEMGIEPKKYWQDLERWLDQVTSRKVTVY